VYTSPEPDDASDLMPSRESQLEDENVRLRLRVESLEAELASMREREAVEALERRMDAKVAAFRRVLGGTA